MPVIRSLPVAFQRINEGSPGVNYDTTGVTQVAAGDGVKTQIQRTLLRSGTIDVPDGHEITSAILRAYAKSGSGGTVDLTLIEIHDDDTDWVPAEATWNSKDFGVAWGAAGGNPSGESDRTNGIVTEAGTIELDITNVVAGALLKAPARIDAVLKLHTELDDGKAITLVSAAGDDTEEQPQIVLVMNPIAVERRGGDQPFVPRVGGWTKGASED